MLKRRQIKGDKPGPLRVELYRQTSRQYAGIVRGGAVFIKGCTRDSANVSLIYAKLIRLFASVCAERAIIQLLPQRNSHIHTQGAALRHAKLILSQTRD
jgi:hypothetical protein